MKKLYAAITVFALSLTLGVTAMAQGKTADKGAKKPGCASCNKTCATPEQMKKFKADSIDLRQEMMNKRFDLQRENLKETPDSARVATIKAEIEAIKVRIDALKTAAKIPVSASCFKGDCPLMDGDCAGCKNGKGGADCKGCTNCDSSKGCDCKTCNCKNCRNGKACAKAAKSTKQCANCNKKSGKK